MQHDSSSYSAPPLSLVLSHRWASWEISASEEVWGVVAGECGHCGMMCATAMNTSSFCRVTLWKFFCPWFSFLISSMCFELTGVSVDSLRLACEQSVCAWGPESSDASGIRFSGTLKCLSAWGNLGWSWSMTSHINVTLTHAHSPR